MTDNIQMNYSLILASELNLEEMKNHFQYYRGNLSNNLFRMINNNYLNFLSNISQIYKFNLEQNTTRDEINNHKKINFNNIIFEDDFIKKRIEEILFSIIIDIKLFYHKEKNYENANKAENNNHNPDFIGNNLKTNYYRLIKKKQIFIEIHETLTRIGFSLTANVQFSFSLINSNFYSDIAEYLIFITSTPNLIEKIANLNQNKKDDISVKKLLTSIIENSIFIILNGIKCLVIDENYSMKNLVR